ncbi:hypothetical protein N8I77_005676 [Diaporthe amygdali]|uniref:Uncharacterized protein n=1 Tax=Phomopsis amygdali TaxID=1214568 RepID=A0AAD9SGE5_PHOAM|nr:hypothetical protein N8I77_005676 [Diaporthe amygdali]
MTSLSSSLDLATYHPQKQSPLFGVFPGEIRNKIFAFALLQYEDDAAAYPEDSYWYRPGFKGPKRGNSSLLRTCKLAYAEGQKVFLEEIEWAFWFDRGPRGRSGSNDCLRFFRDLSDSQVRDLEQVRFFTQMYWLEGGHNINNIFNNNNFRPSRLTITIRYSDWWFWEHNEPLRMREDWLINFNGSHGLRELRVEYETLAWKKAQMDAIVTRNKERVLKVRDGGYLSAEDTRLEEWRWTGPSKLGGQTWEHHGEGDVVEYVVVTDTWKYHEGPIPEDVLQRQAALQQQRLNSILAEGDWTDEDEEDDEDEDEEEEEEEEEGEEFSDDEDSQD